MRKRATDTPVLVPGLVLAGPFQSDLTRAAHLHSHTGPSQASGFGMGYV